MVNVRRGDIFYADLSPVVGSEQGGIRPVLIVQNDVGNRFSPTVIAAAITSQKDKARLPPIFSSIPSVADWPGIPLFCSSRSAPLINAASKSIWAAWTTRP